MEYIAPIFNLSLHYGLKIILSNTNYKKMVPFVLIFCVLVLVLCKQKDDLNGFVRLFVLMKWA